MRTLERLEALRTGKLTAVANLEEKLARIREREPRVHAFLEVYEADARAQATAIDAKRAAGEPLGRLAGLVLAVKNNFAVTGKKLTCASRMLEDHVAAYTATAVQRALAEDAVLLGAANLDEFACGSDGTQSAFGPTRNPRDGRLVAGGTSSGSAAAVAAGFADLALGSDTGGSIRCPAAFCGVAGLKPTNGLVSRHGLVDQAMSFDTPGPLAPDAEGAALLLEVIAGEDSYDARTTGARTAAYSRSLAQVPRRIGVLRESLARSDPRVAEKVSASLEALRAKGAQVVELSSPMLDYAVATYYLIETAEFASGMQKYDGIRYGAAWPAGADMAAAASVARGASLGLEIKRRILIGTFVSTKEHRDAWYTTALRAREKIRSEFARLFAQADVLATPAMPVPPWPVGERARPAEMYAADVLTVPANLAGVPAGVAPLGDGAGVMFTAPRFEESRVLAAMRAVEALQP